LALNPRIVYEVGCGTGMILMRAASLCDRYTATDFSPVVLGRLRDQLQSLPDLLDRVHLLERTADDFDGLPCGSFDTVVINSVVQHFPNLSYLSSVLRNAVKLVKDGGHIFIGDLPSFVLQPLLASSVSFFQATDQITVEELRGQAGRRIQAELQLLVSPA